MKSFIVRRLYEAKTEQLFWWRQGSLSEPRFGNLHCTPAFCPLVVSLRPCPVFPFCDRRSVAPGQYQHSPCALAFSSWGADWQAAPVLPLS